MERGTLKQLEDLLAVGKLDENLLRQALTHGSHMTARHGSYERLEFLGDRVLGLVIAELLWHKFAKEDEGSLSRRFVDLVRKETLAQIAAELKLWRFIRVSRSEEQSGGRENPSLLADVMEALLAAVYLDKGPVAARQLVARLWEPYIEQRRKPPRDPKTALQEWAQGQGKPLPTYEELTRQGPSHAPTFVMRVTVQGLEPEEASASSKRRAEQTAAQRLLALHAPHITTVKHS